MNSTMDSMQGTSTDGSTANAPETVVMDALRDRLAHTLGAVRIGEALWQRLDGEDAAKKGGFCEMLANHIDDDVAFVDVLREALGEGAPEGGARTLGEQRCLDVVLDPAASLFRALHAVLVVRRNEIAARGALVDLCMQANKHALAERCAAAMAKAEEHAEAVKRWLDVVEKARPGRRAA